MTYAPRQAEVLYKHWRKSIDIFIVGGVADGLEAQTIKREFNDVECMGFEPNEAAYLDALKDFPGELFKLALWNENVTEMELKILHGGKKDKFGRASRITGPEPETRCETEMVQAVRLDKFASRIGENRLALWLDIEYAEMQALEGAGDLLHQTDLINVEIVDFRKHLETFKNFLQPFGLKLVDKWNAKKIDGRIDAIFGR